MSELTLYLFLLTRRPALLCLNRRQITTATAATGKKWLSRAPSESRHVHAAPGAAQQDDCCPRQRTRFQASTSPDKVLVRQLSTRAIVYSTAPRSRGADIRKEILGSRLNSFK